MSEVTVHRVEHTMTRLNISTGIPFDEFRAAFEAAAPLFDPAPYLKIAERGGSWADVKAEVAAYAPYDLMLYAIIEATPVMAVAGHAGQSVEYLLGNHVIAETMYRHNPNALLYAPLRVLVFTDDAGHAVFGIDQPSTVFAGLDHPDVAATGILLDHKVSGLLRGIGVAVVEQLVPDDE
ncbi:hypothetical protein [Mycolicibacterium bacteremicum]|uniref:DUF302 domain-containing protein n=1 Tax=Mycolicibacterium bacteremicum TaxID=564198 RepID=A0A1W9YWF7_MYCBA|nr:hypothetical protein [Mycolicibacterium bacteremicum]MCV7431564.1 DUF302 domain-containing protein [Mycolicibacterium bacteremicum]ORA04394.1 hypothetical protein BST17_13980 [Mycolicibacterium bacteremicum]